MNLWCPLVDMLDDDVVSIWVRGQTRNYLWENRLNTRPGIMTIGPPISSTCSTLEMLTTTLVAPFVLILRNRLVEGLVTTCVIVVCRRRCGANFLVMLGRARQPLVLAQLCSMTEPNCWPHLLISLCVCLGLLYIYLVNCLESVLVPLRVVAALIGPRICCPCLLTLLNLLRISMVCRLTIVRVRLGVG